MDGIVCFAGGAFWASGQQLKRDPTALFQRATDLARGKLADPDFGPEDLAAALHISRSKLFRLFAEYGGVQR